VNAQSFGIEAMTKSTKRQTLGHCSGVHTSPSACWGNQCLLSEPCVSLLATAVLDSRSAVPHSACLLGEGSGRFRDALLHTCGTREERGSRTDHIPASGGCRTRASAISHEVAVQKLKILNASYRSRDFLLRAAHLQEHVSTR